MNLFKNSKKKSKGKGATATTAAGATAAGAPASTAAAGTAGSKPRKHSTSFFGRKKKTKKQQEPKLQLQLKLQLKQNQEPFGFASQRSLADSDATETATNATVSPRANYDEDLPGNPYRQQQQQQQHQQQQQYRQCTEHDDADSVSSSSLESVSGHDSDSDNDNDYDYDSENSNGNNSKSKSNSNSNSNNESAALLEAILASLTERDHLDWAAEQQQQQQQHQQQQQQQQQWQPLLKQTVERMNAEPNNPGVQHPGTRIVYKLTSRLLEQHRQSQTLTTQTTNNNTPNTPTQPQARNRNRNGSGDGTDTDTDTDPSWWYAEKPGDGHAHGHAHGTARSNASLDPETIELLRESVASVLAAMEAFPDDDVLLEDACLALEVLTAPTANASKGFGFDLDAKTMQRILQEILLAMEGFADNPVVVSCSLGVLGHLSSDRNGNINTNINTNTNTNTNRNNHNSNSNSNHHSNSNSNSNHHNSYASIDLRHRMAKYATRSVLHGMREHRDDAELYTKGCRALANFTRDNPGGQHQLACKEGLGLRIVAEALQQSSSSSSSSNNDNNDNNNDNNNVIDNEAELLRNLRLRVAALEVLKHLSTHPSVEVKGKIVLGGGAAQIVDRLLQVLQQTGKDLIDNNYHVESHTFGNQCDDIDDDDDFGLSLTILGDALQTLENLADIESVVTLDDPRSPHSPSLGITCGSVTRANNTAEDIQKQLAKAVKPVLDTILRHPNRTTIRYRGLSCLHKLTLAHADAIANHHGGIPTLLNVLAAAAPPPPPTDGNTGSSNNNNNSNGNSNSNTAISESELHERVLACLTGLLSPSSNADGLDLVASMQTEDGLDAVFRTVRRYQSRPEVIATALEAIFYLSCRVRVVLASIAGSSPRIRHGVEAEAARNLRAQLCLEENVFVLLGTVQQYLPVNETICQRGLGVLVNIQAFRVAADAADAANAAVALRRQQTALAADGGIKLVLAVMRRHGLAVAIQEYGVGLLESMLGGSNGNSSGSSSSSGGSSSSSSSDWVVRREFYDEEGISTVLAAMMIHPDHVAIQSSGCDVLIRMVVPEPRNRFDLLEDDSEALEACAYYKRCLREETDATGTIEAALERFPTNRYLQHRGAVLLKALAVPPSARTRVASAAAASFSTAAVRSSQILSTTASLLSASSSSSSQSRG